MSTIIGFEAKRANANRTGLGNYSRFVIRSLKRAGIGDRLNLYIPKRKANAEYDALLEMDGVTSHLPDRPVWRRLSALWRVFGVAQQLQRDGVKLFHGLSNELPAASDGGDSERGDRSRSDFPDPARLLQARGPVDLHLEIPLRLPAGRPDRGGERVYEARHRSSVRHRPRQDRGDLSGLRRDVCRAPLRRRARPCGQGVRPAGALSAERGDAGGAQEPAGGRAGTGTPAGGDPSGRRGRPHRLHGPCGALCRRTRIDGPHPSAAQGDLSRSAPAICPGRGDGLPVALRGVRHSNHRGAECRHSGGGRHGLLSGGGRRSRSALCLARRSSRAGPGR